MLFAGLVLALAVSAAPPARPQFLKPNEMYKLLEGSPRKYDIKTPEKPVLQWMQQNASLAWEPRRPQLDMTRVEKNADGSRSVRPWSGSKEAYELLEKIEPSFEAHDYAAAEKG